MGTLGSVLFTRSYSCTAGAQHLGANFNLAILCQRPEDCPEIAEDFAAADVAADVVGSREGGM